jgi:hypothetical protein
MAKVIASLESSQKSYDVVAYYDAQNRFSFVRKSILLRPLGGAVGEIHWDPNYGMQTSKGKTIGPYMTLGHELIHAYLYDLNPLTTFELSSRGDALYDDDYERITIAIERLVAKSLGEALRYDHFGRYVRHQRKCAE